LNDSLDLLTSRARAGLTRPGTASKEDDEDACAAFGFLRGLRDRAVMLEFRFANGNSLSLPYSWLGPIRYDPSLGMLLRFVGDLVHVVLIEGSNLNVSIDGGVSLYDRGILRHRVTWIREMPRERRSGASENGISIEGIRTLVHKPDEEPAGLDWLDAFGR
jgi:hypothetical protein